MLAFAWPATLGGQANPVFAQALRAISVTSTPVSLLNRLKSAQPDAAEWRHLHEIYLPLIHTWLERVPALEDEFADLAQEVMLILVRELPRFERAREGSFRTWLRRVTVNRVRAFTRQRRRRPPKAEGTDAFLSQLEDPASAVAQQWDREHDEHVFAKILATIEQKFARRL